MAQIRGVDCGLNNWDVDFPFGKEGEAMTVKFLQQKFGMAFIDYEDSKTHDLEMVEPKFGSTLWIEVKRDRYESGNMVVEYSGKWGPSGISTTLSHFWVQFFEDTQEYWIIETNKLRRLLNSQRQKKNVFWRGRGGDHGATWMYFLKRACFHGQFKIYKKIDSEFMRVYWSTPTGAKAQTIYHKELFCEKLYSERNPAQPYAIYPPFIRSPELKGCRKVFGPSSPTQDFGRSRD